MNNDTYGYADTPALEDHLGLKKYFDGLSSFILNCPEPMTIAIQGGWGSGKTSAIEMILKELGEHKDLIQIKFNTWQYSRIAGDNLFLPLLRRMVDTLKEQIAIKAKEQGKETSDKYTAIKEKNSKAAVILGMLAKGLKSGIDIFSETGGAIIDFFSGNPSPEAGDSREFSQEAGMIYDYIFRLKEFLDSEITYLQEELGVNRIIFYVDDLDRLEPEAAVGFLEDLKNFVICKNCIFILALDHEIVWRGIQRKYNFSSTGEIEEYSSRFFDKLIQMPFSIPVHQYDVEQYVESLIDDKEEVPEYARIIKVFGDTNPRSIKRVLNIFQMYKHIRNQPYEGHDRELLALLLLQMNHEKLYKSLVLAVSKELSEPEEPLRKIFCDNDIPCRHLDEWTGGECTDREKMIVTALKELFGLNEPGNGGYRLLFDIIGATEITGVAVESTEQRIEETKKLTENYLQYLGFTYNEIKDCYECPRDRNITVSIRLPGHVPNHVNLNITARSELVYQTAEGRAAYVRDHLLEDEAFEIQTSIPLEQKPYMDIAYNSEGVLVLHGVSAGEAASMKFAGRILKNLAKTGRLFPESDKN